MRLNLYRSANNCPSAKGEPSMRHRTPYSLLQSFVSVTLVISLLAVSTPAAPTTIVSMAQDTSVSLRFWAYASGLMALFQGRSGERGQPQEKQKDRDARVAYIQIVPGDVTIPAFQHVLFGAVAYDQNGDTVSGVKFKWRTSTPERGKGSHISPNGEFRPPIPGTYQIIAEGAGKRAEVTATVMPGDRRPQKGEKPIEEKKVSTRDLPEGATAKLIRPNARGKRAHARTSAAATAPMFQSGGGWDNTNYWSADDPGNTPGTVPGTPVDSGAGSANFQFGAPVLTLPGRGNDVLLSLAYNSRLWNKAGSQMTYDIDRGWPAPGWSLGFGKILYMGSSGGSMIVEQDGTRRPFTGTITNYGYGMAFNGHTTDGSLIDYSTWVTSTGIMTSGIINLPNGTVISCYTTGPGGVYPSSIVDPQGNVISISYVNNTGPKIQNVWDSMGRTITFNYDSYGLLTAVTAPGFNGAGTRTLVRLVYQQLALSPGFAYPAVTSTVVRDYYPWMIKAIYYPATSTGYWFGDSDSYSSYGMLAKVVEQRGMSFSGASLTVQGTITPGSLTRREAYNYPLSANYSLSDAPTYTSCVETWSRDGTNFDTATTTYEVFENSSPRTVTVTLPNGTKTKQFSHNLPGNVLDGLVYQDQILNSSNTVLQSSYVYWQAGQYDSARPWKVETTNEAGQTQRTEYTYAGVFNQVTDIREYDFSGALVRSRRTQFLDDFHYNDRHIRNLPTVFEVYGPDNVTRVSRTEYTYDGQTLQDAPGVAGHSETHNPYAPQWEQCDCYMWDYWQIDCLQWNCYWMTNYDPWTDYRGNVTQITSYADAVNLTGAVTETRRYDITGNVVKSTSSCCDETNFVFNTDMQYSVPMSETRGSPTDGYSQITISNTYDFNTSLPLTAKDPNGLQSQTTYDSVSLRPQSAIASTGSHTDHAYNDAAMSVTSTTYVTPGTGGAIAEQRTQLLNGRGQVRQEQARGASGVWDLVDLVYDNMGQITQQSRPYRSGDTLQWTTFTYDPLGRTTVVTAPDGSASQTFYNEASRPSVASSSAGETRRIKDPWGRERWGRLDVSGQLVEIVEPDPNGNGSVASNGMVTTYTYNTLGKLSGVTQGSQTRSFKYDSLGRLVAQKMAEASATLNDAGSYVGSGMWSEVFTYDSRSNVTSRTDARGVKTILTYNSDPLNRLQSMSFDTSGFGDTGNPILAAASVTYSYRTKSSPSELKDVTQVASITTSGVSTESYQFDSEGRMSSKTLTLTSRPSYPMVTDYIYDGLDRTVDVRYPAQYGNGSQLRKVVHHDYDEASRLSSIAYDSQSFASNISYNAASQTTSLNVGTGTNQMVENYGYNAQTGLLSSQTVARTAAPSTYLLNLSYDYADANGKRTGQLAKITNNLDNNKNRGYEYDALGRLKRATGGQNVNWAQRYLYDRYGNRTFAFSHTADQYIRNFYQKALNRQPNSTELNNWLSTLQTAYAQGSSQFWTAMQNLGAAVFMSQEYANRNRDNHWYVYDLYQAYLWRDPDAGGWANWEANCVTNGRNATRAGFDWSIEFETHVSGTSPYSPPGGNVPADGWGSLHYEVTNNRVNDSGWNYDAAGNQTRVQRGAGWQRYQYDAANRLVKVKADDNVTVVSSYTYGDTNERLIIEEGGTRTYYACEGGSTISEFVESGASTTPAWSKSYIYFGQRLLSTLTPNGSGGEITQHHHPDRLGTRVVSNPSNGTSFEQVTLPFGTALAAESTGSTNRRFTSYDRSAVNGLDYALNRHYDPDQGRFTQVDPIGMSSATLTSPQTLNLYAYCANDPVNHVDPSGLGFFSFLKKLFKGIAKFIAKVLSNKWVLLVVGIALGVLSGVGFYWAATITTEFFLPAAITLAAMSAALIVAAFHPNFLRVVRTIGAIASTVHNAIGLINRTINGRILAGTPPWNPGTGVGPVNNFTSGGVRRPLDEIQQSIFDTSLKYLLAQLKDKNSPCAKFLREKLGLSANRVARALKGIRAFNGRTSTLSLKDAGLLPLSGRGSTTTSVAALFRDPNLNAARAAYSTPDDRGATLRDIYFGYVFRPQTILHETLHFFTGMNDERLAAALGVKLEGLETGGISEALKNAGCGW
jgi:RHS repeat-associated protein